VSLPSPVPTYSVDEEQSALAYLACSIPMPPSRQRFLSCRSMNLEDFKFIYWMEYAHRMWGRLLGVVFAGPALYFVARGHINKPLGRRLGLLFLMGGTQGLVGWWMVRSGLKASCLLLRALLRAFNPPYQASVTSTPSISGSHSSVSRGLGFGLPCMKCGRRRRSGTCTMSGCLSSF